MRSTWLSLAVGIACAVACARPQAPGPAAVAGGEAGDRPPAGEVAPDEAAPAEVTVEVTDPCVYSGRLRTAATIFASARGDEVVGAVRGELGRDDSFVEATVWPPASRGERARIAVHAPFEVEGWLDAAARPLAARVRLDVVPDHIWLDPDYEVHAFGAAEGTIEVAEPLAANQHLEVEPGGVFRRVPCESLALSTMAGFIGPTASAGDAFVRLEDGPVDLYDAPGGRVIGRVIDGGDFQRLEERDGFVRITEAEPVHVDVWVRARHTAPVADEVHGVEGGVPGGVVGGVVGGVPGGIAVDEEGDDDETEDDDQAGDR